MKYAPPTIILVRASHGLNKKSLLILDLKLGTGGKKEKKKKKKKKRRNLFQNKKDHHLKSNIKPLKNRKHEHPTFGVLCFNNKTKQPQGRNLN